MRTADFEAALATGFRAVPASVGGMRRARDPDSRRAAHSTRTGMHSAMDPHLLAEPRLAALHVDRLVQAVCVVRLADTDRFNGWTRRGAPSCGSP